MVSYTAWAGVCQRNAGCVEIMMTKCQTPVFLAREHRDADTLIEQLHEVRVDAELGEVMVGEARPGWQVLVAASDAERARSIATVLEVQRYGNWENRSRDEAHWGVMEDESSLGNPTEIYSAQSVVQANLLKNPACRPGNYGRS